MVISPYQNSIVNYNFKPFEVNLDLAAKVLSHKQGEFDANYAHLQKLKQEALNINFLNQKEQGKVNEYNKQINEYFSNRNGEFGDLSQNGIVDGHMQLFNKLGSDTKLIKRFQQDRKLQTELKSVMAKGKSKDPEKNGFHPMNFANYQRRLSEYSNMDLDEYETLHPNAPTPTVKGYQNYIDLHKLAKEASLDVPEEEFIRERRLGDGTIIKETIKKRDPQKVQAAIDRVISSSGATQLAVEAEYHHYQNVNNPNYLPQLWEESNSFLLQRKQGLVDRKKLLNPEQAVEIDNINQELKQIDLRLSNPMDFSTKSNDEKIGILTQLHKEGTLRDLTNSYSYVNVSQELKKDDVYWEGKKLARLYKKDAVDAGYKQSLLNIKGAELALKQKKQAVAESSGTSDFITPETFVDGSNAIADETWDDLKEIQRNTKSFLQTGISSEDLGLTEQRVNEILDRRSEIQLELSQLFQGGGVLTQGERITKLKEEDEQLRKDLSVPEMTNKEVWLKNIANNQEYYDDTPVANAIEVLAAKEAVVNLKRKGIKPTNPEIEAEMKNVLNDSNSAARLQKMEYDQLNAGYADILNEANLLGGDENSAKDEARWKSTVERRRLVGRFPKKTVNLDLSSVTGDAKVIRESNVTKLKAELSNYQVLGNNNQSIQGYLPLDIASIDNTSFGEVQAVNNIMKKITFKEDIFKPKAGSTETRKYYILGKSGETHFIDDNNRSIVIKNANVKNTIRNTIKNRFNNLNNLESLDAAPERLTANKKSYKGAFSGSKVYIKLLDTNEEIIIDKSTGTLIRGDKSTQYSSLINVPDGDLMKNLDDLIK